MSAPSAPAAVAAGASIAAVAGAPTGSPPEAKALVEKFRKDYKPLPVHVELIDVDVSMGEDATTVKAKLHLRLAAGAEIAAEGLRLDGGKDVVLHSIAYNGAAVAASDYSTDAKGLVLAKGALVAAFQAGGGAVVLETSVSIKPQENTLLEGLYKSGGNFSTQCEAEGFRHITYYFDRPDCMSKYVTRIEADKAKYPVLLSNGNLEASGDLEGGRHFAVWRDPFPKPCYLFALVAGDLAVKEDTFRTMSGRDVALRIYVEPRNIARVDFAMASLKKAMKWDEDTFGLEYDLDLFNIVAVDDFNMGAMENKSLNIFNSRLVLATAATASDFDFDRIEGVVGHEYFHNWTGNRVTCRDWFQLTLKEGLTVYRDQEFSSDMNSRPVQRLTTVASLRASQFEEDRGPMAHPVRPESYVKMDNFYTATVYNKGAEVVRLYETVLGKAGFRKGMDLYFQRHDGNAVTCDDFLAAMSDANGKRDLSALARWYSQAGTPELTIKTAYDAAAQTLTLTASQVTPPTAGQPTKQPVLIPIRTAVLGDDGQLLPLRLRGSAEAAATEVVLMLTEASQEFVFEGVAATRPVPSLLRGFSAPVRMTVEGQTEDDLLRILRYDTDGFNRYESGQVLARRTILAAYNAPGAVTDFAVPEALTAAYAAIAADERIDGAFKAFALTLPSRNEVIGAIPKCDPVRLHDVIVHIGKAIARCLRPTLEAIIRAVPAVPEPYVFNAAAVAKRALVNRAFLLLAQLGDAGIEAQTMQRLQTASNMTDEAAMLNALNRDCPTRAAALAHFEGKWANEPLVYLKYMTVVAAAEVPGNILAVKAIMDGPRFTMTNPNSVYSLLGGFMASAVNFHNADGSGYAFAADALLAVDRLNPQAASRLIGQFAKYRAYDDARQALMRAQLERIVATEGISDNIREIAVKSLNA